MKKISFICLFFCSITILHAQKITYKVSFPNAAHHEAHIEVTANGIPPQAAIFRMSRSSPGRYATHEFGKNVYDVVAMDATGKPIPVKRVDGDVYEIPNHKGTVSIAYTLYGNYADGTYAGIDPESIHLNMPASFMWMEGMENAPIAISFTLPEENKAVFATQLVPGADNHSFTAPNLQYFMDSPVKIGDLKISSWTISNPNGKKQTMRIALESDATEEAFAAFTEQVKKITEEARAVYGEYPDYDYGVYTFIAGANPFVKGDGMEHRNSTMITVPLRTFNASFLLGVFSHEFFHCWNVERIRPKTLEPFNFRKSNMSNELWFAEGFTQYYGELMLTRAGLSASGSFLSTIASLVNTKLNTPGGKFYSPVQASNHAVFVDAAVSIDRNNYANMFTSYYTYGASVALALDLSQQSGFGKTLDAYMQAMWMRFGKTGLPYDLATMQETLATVTNKTFAADFYAKYINGHEAPDYARLLSNAGYTLTNSEAGKVSLGINWQSNGQGRLAITNSPLKGTPAYLAGLDMGDEITELDSQPVKNTSDINTYLQSKKTGETVTLSFFHRNHPKQRKLVLGEEAKYTLVPFDQLDKQVTTNMKKIRDSWFSSKVN